MNNEALRLKQILDVIKKYHLIKNINPINVREALEELGPTFVKFGQIMSSRNDIIPAAYCEELKKLRSNAKPMSFSEIEDILNREYDNKTYDIFKIIEKKPLGSASIAQTHRAVLKSGEEVVIKVQRKNIYAMMTMDSKLLKKAINILHVDKLLGNIMNLGAFINEMYETAKEEMDFTIEASHMKEFADYNKEVNYLKLIKTYPEYSTRYVLVMEYISGCNINEIDKLVSYGYNMNEIALKLAQNYIKQAIDDGFYHADPHADNIKIENGKIVFLDFGMMGRLSSQNKSLLNQCIKAIVKSDVKEIDHILTMMDTEKNTIDHMKLSNDISRVLEKNKTTEIANIDLKEFVNDMYELLNSNSITLPKDITMLARGIVVISGLIEEICPEISLYDVLRDRFNINNLLNKEQIKKLIVKGIINGNDIVNIPEEMLTTLKGINSGELRFNVEMNHSVLQNNKIDRILHQFIVTILDVALIIGMSIMSTRRPLPYMFYVYACLAAIFTIWLFLKMSINKIKRKK